MQTDRKLMLPDDYAHDFGAVDLPLITVRDLYTTLLIL